MNNTVETDVEKITRLENEVKTLRDIIKGIREKLVEQKNNRYKSSNGF